LFNIAIYIKVHSLSFCTQSLTLILSSPTPYEEARVNLLSKSCRKIRRWKWRRDGLQFKWVWRKKKKVVLALRNLSYLSLIFTIHFSSVFSTKLMMFMATIPMVLSSFHVLWMISFIFDGELRKNLLTNITITTISIVFLMLWFSTLVDSNLELFLSYLPF